MQTVWVAGGAGFLGSHLCRTLLSKNYRVVCLDNLISGSENTIQDLQNTSYFQFIHQDIITLGLIDAKKLPKPDFIFHLASPASPNLKSNKSYMAYPIETLLVNSVGTHNLLEIAKQSGARFLYASTSEVYGDPHVSPQPETYFGNVNPNGIRSVYDEGKRFGEAMTMAYVRKFSLDCRIARIFNTYGPYMQIDDGRVVSNFINQAIRDQALTIYGDGKQTRSFCYVSDLIAGLIAFMFTPDLSGEVINIGNPIERSINDFAELVKEITKIKAAIVYEPLPADDPMQRKPDITKAKKLLQWEPVVSLEEGLKKTIAYFQQLRQ